MRLRQHRVRRARDQSACQQCIDRGQAQRTQGQRHRLFVQHAGLQREGDQRRAEHQAAVDQIATPGRLPARIQQRNQQIEGEEQQQERFGAGELGRVVLQHAPEGADAEGERETEQVQHTPRATPGDGENARVEHGVVAEQPDVVAAAGGQPQRRHEARQDAQHRQRARVLHHRQHAQPRHQRDRAGKSETGREQIETLEGGEDGQQQHADGAALQGQREHPPALALVPAEGQQAQRTDGDARQPQFYRYHQPALIADVLEQRGNTGQQHQHADLHRHIALGEPVFDRANRALDQVRQGRFGRQRRHCRLRWQRRWRQRTRGLGRRRQLFAGGDRR
ncbi:hypothetical protein D3C72_1372790 [compost metagenome]